MGAEELMLLNCGVGEDSWESLGLQGDPKEISPGCSWKDWCWSWNSNTLSIWCEELTHWKRLWCWERLKARGEGDERGWNGWMVSLTRWSCLWELVMDSEACYAAVHGVSKSQTWLSDWTELNWKIGPPASLGQWLWNSRGRRRRGDWGKSTRVYAARDPS